MRIAVTGSHGLVGTALVPFLSSGGHEVIRLVRTPEPSQEPTVMWDPAAGRIDAAALDGLEGVVHLAGESIAVGRWTPERKRAIRDSRVVGTRLLCEALAHLVRPPTVLVSASAIGYYGDRRQETLTERSAAGHGFLADVCEAWERATAAATARGIRVVNLRFGIILTPDGGALAKMLPLFRLGLGGTLGDGAQRMSWIALDDVLGAIHHALTADQLRGPVNAVSPNPVTNREFTTVLGRVLGRPTMLPAPAFMLRLLFGEFADEGLLSSAQVLPGALSETGYAFRYPVLDAALAHLLKESAQPT